jgi:molybdate transport system regulatory protein
MARPEPFLSIRIRVHWGGQFAMGPGKADLLETVASTQSIAAAGRALGYSYTKTRRLLEEMNSSYRGPLVATTRGGPHGGGAVVTEVGYQVLALFRDMEAKAMASVQEGIQGFRSFLGEAPAGGDQSLVRHHRNGG